MAAKIRTGAPARRAGSALGAAIAALALTGCASAPPRAAVWGLPLAPTSRAAPAAEEAVSAEEKLRDGDRLRESGRLDRAVWAYLEAVRLDPADPRPRQRIGALQLSQDPARAARIFSALLEEHPDSARAHAGLGLSRLAQGAFEPARDSLERAAALDPDAHAVQVALGTLYDRLGEHGRAQRHHRRALELRPRDATVLGNLGVSRFLAGHCEEAESAFRQALLLDPADAALHNHLGLCLGCLGRYEEALAAFRAAGGEQAAQSNLATAYLLNGDLERAVEHYERALLAGGDGELSVLRNLRAALAARAERP